VSILAVVCGLASGCGDVKAEKAPPHRFVAGDVRACLESSVGVVVIESDQASVAGDISGGTFQVRLRGAAAELAFAANEEGAANTAAAARGLLATFGAHGNRAHHLGNVAYWQLDDSDAPIRPIEKCLRTTAEVSGS
jgi:hypothetical protein